MRNLCLALLLCLSAFARAEDSAAVDPEAKHVLDQMVRAYKGLHSLNEESVYGDTTTSGVSTTKFVFQKPNRLYLEVNKDATAGTFASTTRVVCDGKFLYSFSSSANTFSKIKAPKDMKGFKDYAASLEMAIVVGLDPFAELCKRARSVKLEPAEDILDEKVDVLSFDIGNQVATGEMRFYIAKLDHLVRRFTFEAKEIPKPVDPPKFGEEAQTPPLATPPVRMNYNNTIHPEGVAKSVFAWVPPPGALEQVAGPDYGLLGQGRMTAGSTAADKSSRKVKQPKTQSYLDIVKKGNRNK